MKERPIGDLVDVLMGMDAKIEYAGSPTFPPLHITSSQLKSKQVTVDVSKSSQFVSALMMIGTDLPEGPSRLDSIYRLPSVRSSYPRTFVVGQSSPGHARGRGGAPDPEAAPVHRPPGSSLREGPLEPVFRLRSSGRFARA